jgi:CHAD domain-containing protein
MKRTGKWIDGTTPEQPVTEAARLAVRLRLKLVEYYLPLAAWQADEDPEYVHQLRVATRRATAALGIFADLLPQRRLKQLKRKLHRVRRAANDARDLDVLIARLKVSAEESPDPAWRDLLGDLKARRDQAQPPIRQVDKKLRDWEFRGKVRGLVRRVDLRDSAQGLPVPTFVDAARRALTPLVEAFFMAIRGPLDELPAMHQCRIRGKKLRYAMEVFAGAFPPEFRTDLYAQIEQVQELLGQINDRATAYRQFTEWLAAEPAESTRRLLNDLQRAEQISLEQARQDFLTWWSDDRAAALSAQFADYFGTLRVVPPRTAAVG